MPTNCYQENICQTSAQSSLQTLSSVTLCSPGLATHGYPMLVLPLARPGGGAGTLSGRANMSMPELEWTVLPFGAPGSKLAMLSNPRSTLVSQKSMWVTKGLVSREGMWLPI